MSTAAVVIALLILIVAAAIWAIMPRQVGTLVGSAIVVVAALFVFVSVV